MSIATDIIRNVCIHECGHCLVAIKMGITVRAIDVFNIHRNCKGGEAGIVIPDASTVTPFPGATMSAAAEVAERLCNIEGWAFKYPLAYAALNGRPLPTSMDRDKEGCVGVCMKDGANFTRYAAQLRANDPHALLNQCQQQAAAILRANWDEFQFRVSELEKIAINARIQDRIPVDGIPGDGPHWFDGGPKVIRTLADYVTEWKALRRAARASGQLTN